MSPSGEAITTFGALGQGSRRHWWRRDPRRVL